MIVNQKALVLLHLLDMGSINKEEALEYGVYRLSSIIDRLRRENNIIITTEGYNDTFRYVIVKVGR